MFLRCFFLIGLLLCVSLPAHSTPALQRGINLSSWFANAPRQPLQEQDFVQIAKAGFDHVRLPVNPEFFGFAFDEKAKEIKLDLTPVDKAIDLAIKHKLAVVFDLHPRQPFKDTLEKNEWAEKQFTDLWVYLSKHYDEDDYPADKLAFELLNEPQYYRATGRYEELAKKLVVAVRLHSPKRTIIVGAPYGSSIEGLRKMKPFDEANLIYDFHFYEPYLITHQGIASGFEKKMIRYFREVPYPSVLVDKGADAYAKDAPDKRQAQKDLREYTENPWNADHIAVRLQLMQDWAKQNKARVICGEYGVLRNYIKSSSRYRWIGDTRRALEAAGIPWQYWDYTDAFGIVELSGGVTGPDPVDGSIRLIDLSRGKRTIEPEAIKALGLFNP